MKIEASQNFTIFFGQLAQDSLHQIDLLTGGHVLLGIIAAVRNAAAQLDIQLFPAAVHYIIYVCGYLAADYGPDKAHQAVGFPQIAAPDGLHDDQKSIVDLVVQFLRTELPAQKESDTFGKDAV